MGVDCRSSWMSRDAKDIPNRDISSGSDIPLLRSSPIARASDDPFARLMQRPFNICNARAIKSLNCRLESSWITGKLGGSWEKWRKGLWMEGKSGEWELTDCRFFFQKSSKALFVRGCLSNFNARPYLSCRYYWSIPENPSLYTTRVEIWFLLNKLSCFYRRSPLKHPPTAIINFHELLSSFSNAESIPNHRPIFLLPPCRLHFAVRLIDAIESILASVEPRSWNQRFPTPLPEKPVIIK